MKKIGQIDLETGEIINSFTAVIIQPVKNGFERGRKMMMCQNAMLQIAMTKELKSDDKTILFALLSVLDYQNHIQISQVEMGEKLGINKHNVSRSIKKLLTLGIILEGVKVGRSKSYLLNPNIGWKGNGKSHKQALSDKYKHLSVVK